MKLYELYEILNDFAPISLSREFCQNFGGYDNSGIIVESDSDIDSVLFCLDLTTGAVERAKEIGAQAIVTHHPAIYSPIKKVDGALLKAINSGMGIISMHLNMDFATRGVDHYFAVGLGGENAEALLKLSGGGYGRIWTEKTTLGEMVERCKTAFCSDKIVCYGNATDEINSIATFCGAGFDEDAIEAECDLIISADAKHHLILNALEKSKKIILVTHYAGENYAFKRIYGDLSQDSRMKKLKLNYFDDKRLL